MDTVAFLSIGVLAGGIAGFLTGHRMKPHGEIVAGIVGSYLGAYLFSRFGVPPIDAVGELISAVCGAVLFVSLIQSLPGEN